MIADLTTIGLTQEARDQRVFSIGGSDANTIMSGDEPAILHLWEQKTGRAEPDDLSGKLEVVMGGFTEPLNAAWFQKQTGLVITRRSEVLTCAMDSWRTATLDGMVEASEAIWEAKHTNPFVKASAVLDLYQPQLHHNMDVAGVHRAHLSAFRGNADWVTWAVDYDSAYGAAVHKAEWEFWMSVLADEPPVPYPVIEAPKPAAFKQVSFEGDNAWGDMAATLLETREAAAKCDTAKEGLKKMIAADVTRAFGHGVEFNRDKRGALRLTVMEA